MPEGMFLVGVKVSPSNEVDVTVDSDTSVSIDDCAALSRALDARIEEITDDFSLTVSSAGIGQPLRVLRQYRKLIGKPVEVVLRDGSKILAELSDATEGFITLQYEEKYVEEGKKKKQTRQVVKTFAMDQVKSTAEHLDYK